MTTPTGRTDRILDELERLPILRPVGGAYVTLGAVLGAAWVIGGVTASLLPTGWILPVVLATTGVLMLLRRRFDLVMALWGALLFAVFLLDMTLYMNTVDLGAENPAAFDAVIVVGLLALIPLVLRPQFRR